MTAGEPSRALIAQKAEEVTAYRAGRAFSMRRCKWSLPSTTKLSTAVAYFDGILAWITENHQIRVIHLESGDDESFKPTFPTSRRHCYCSVSESQNQFLLCVLSPAIAMFGSSSPKSCTTLYTQAMAYPIEHYSRTV